MRYMNHRQIWADIKRLEAEEAELYRLLLEGRATEAQKARRRAIMHSIEAKRQRLSSPQGTGAINESIRVVTK